LLVVAADLIWAAWGLNPTAPASFYDANPDAATATRSYWTHTAEQQVKFEQYFRFDNYPVAVEQAAQIRASQLPDLNLVDRCPLLNNFEPLLPGHFTEYIDLLETKQTRPLFQAAGVGALYVPESQPLATPGTRAWLVTSVCWQPDEDALKAAISDPTW